MSKIISVIVPVYDVEAYLPRCLDSILGQTYADLQIILVDDGSPDGSGAICDSYAKKDPRIQVIHQKNGGLSAARNAGLDLAEGEYVAFVDSDDYLEPEAYETMAALAEKHRVPLVVAGRWDVSGRTGEKTRGLCPRAEEAVTGQALAGRIFLWDGCDSSACDKLFARGLFERIRFPLGVVSEDLAVMYRIALQAGAAALCPVPVYNYYHRPGSISGKAPISDKTFHFPRHTQEIYRDIRDNYPAIAPQARYLRVRSLVYLLLVLYQREGGKAYRAEEKAARRELRQSIPFLLTSPYFAARERLTALLLALGLYGPLEQFYHRIKGNTP
ncbi:MAG: glycosyltransferase [Eubacteriales bacterium]|nr:glycosyltransferase [Eubacteriales bacterium]